MKGRTVIAWGVVSRRGAPRNNPDDYGCLLIYKSKYSAEIGCGIGDRVIKVTCIYDPTVQYWQRLPQRAADQTELSDAVKD